MYLLYLFVCIGCSANEFTCGNGQCLDTSRRCDDRLDCSDGSDEEGCCEYEITIKSSLISVKSLAHLN